MKNFENPSIVVEKLEIEDVITTSGYTNDCSTFKCEDLGEW